MRPSFVHFVLFLLAFLRHALAQTPSLSEPSSNPSPSPSPAPASSTPSFSLSAATTSFTTVISTRSAGQNTQITTVILSSFNVTVTPSPTSSTSSATSSTSASATPAPIVLETKLDPAFGVLGALLILTGLPSAFWGHKNRWTSFFLIGFYTFALVCIVLIIKFGILPAINPPSKALRGMFVLASAVAGVAGGAIAIFFWKAARYGIGAWGGFALALWIQCFNAGGVIKSIGFRWILYIGCAVIGFTLCTIPKIHYHILLISTAIVGSSAFILGVDCFTTAGLKEFYVWNLGFKTLFSKYTRHGIEFPVSQTMQIELGLIGAVALMGAAVQLRILNVLQRKLQEISQEQKKRDHDAEEQAAKRFDDVNREREDWEKEHPSPALRKHGRNESGLSSMPLMRDQDGSASPTTAEHRLSTFTLVNEGRPRNYSGVSDLKGTATMEDEIGTSTRAAQNTGVLPTLDLGSGLQDDVPDNFMAEDELKKKDLSPSALEELKRKEELILEIQTIRRSIEALKSETPAPSSSAASRHPSLTSRRTLSIDAGTALSPAAPHARPPRETDPRLRVYSMDASNLGYGRPGGEPISRPTSVPIRDEDWDAYVHDRKLLQPPSGITPPISTTGTGLQNKISMPPAVTEALQQRKKRESTLLQGEQTTDSSDDVPLARIARHQRSSSLGGKVPVTKPTHRAKAGPSHVGGPSNIAAPQPRKAVMRTFEEINERHREKMRGLQGPVTQAEKDEANIQAAKQRWERNKMLEKEDFTRRQVEKMSRLSTSGHEHGHGNRHSRSRSGDRLGNARRLSTMKVEDWRRYQEGVPFPDGQ